MKAMLLYIFKPPYDESSAIRIKDRASNQSGNSDVQKAEKLFYFNRKIGLQKYIASKLQASPLMRPKEATITRPRLGNSKAQHTGRFLHIAVGMDVVLLEALDAAETELMLDRDELQRHEEGNRARLTALLQQVRRSAIQ